jgi:uroporphyrinogen-III synthase
MTDKTLFITRDLNEAMWLRPLERAGWQVRGQSLIDFRALPVADVPPTDWLAFYSPMGAQYFLSQVEGRAWPHFYKQSNFFTSGTRRIRISALGPGTSRAVRQWGLDIDHVGTGHPIAWANQVAARAGSSRILVPRGTTSRQALKQVLDTGSGQFTLIDMQVYENVPLSNPPMISEQFILFTSSLNVRTYVTHHALRSDQTLFALGTSTLASLKELGYQAVLSPAPDIGLICAWIAGQYPKIP